MSMPRRLRLLELSVNILLVEDDPIWSYPL